MIGKDLISVIIPTKNRFTLLVKAIESAINQTWKNIEIIVVDDASSADVGQKIKALQQQFPILIIRNELSKGGSIARNQGVEVAKGKYLAFLDDDDIWLPEKLEKQVQLFESTPNCSAVTCCYFDEIQGKAPKKITVKPIVDEQELLVANDLGGASMYLTTRELFYACGGFNETLKSGQDWDLIIKLWSIGAIVVCPEPLVRYLSHGSVRITNSIRSSYEGYRQVYFIYKDRMTKYTRKKKLAELMFYRVKLGNSFPVSNIIRTIRMLNPKDSLIFALRYIKFFITKPKTLG